jgi:signal transduction histidine kinase
VQPGPFTRWPRAADAVLAALLFGLTLALTDGPGRHARAARPRRRPAPGRAAVRVGSAALYWRRQAPVVVLVVVLAAWALTLGSGHADLGGQALVAVYGLGRYLNADRWGHVGVEAALVVLVLDGVTADIPWGEVAFGVVVFFAVWYAGRRLRLRAERAGRLLRERQAEAERITAEERARIARELHDVVAHRVSMMTVQAGAAKTVAAADPRPPCAPWPPSRTPGGRRSTSCGTCSACCGRRRRRTRSSRSPAWPSSARWWSRRGGPGSTSRSPPTAC